MSNVAEVEAVAEKIVEAIDEAANEAAEQDEKDNSKHRRTVVEIEGVKCERIWGYAYFPVEKVREFTQFCRDTDRKVNDLIQPIISGGVEALFANEIEPTADQRAAERKTSVPNSEEALQKAEAKLAAQQAKVAEQLAAVRARAAALKAAQEPTEEVATVLGHNNGHGKRR